MSEERFLRLRLSGARFDGHAVPLEFLKKLAVLEEMIIETAKWRFLEDNPDRHRLLRGFKRGIYLELKAVEQGSAVLEIELAGGQPLLSPLKIYWVVARDAIMNVIGAAAQEQSIVDLLPDKVLGCFRKMGRNLLQEDERVEFGSPGNPATATLTRNVLQRLAAVSSAGRMTSQKISIRGGIAEADQDEMTFEIRLNNGTKVEAPIDPQYLEKALEAFKGYKNGTRVLLRGIGCFNRDRRLLRFDSVDHLRILDPLDVGLQLDGMRSMKAGWLEGAGLAPANAGLDWLTGAFERHFPGDAPPPYLYPTETGGVQAEWSLDQNEITLEVDLKTHRGEWHALNMETGAVSERTLNCDSRDDWGWLAAEIETMNRGGV